MFRKKLASIADNSKSDLLIIAVSSLRFLMIHFTCRGECFMVAEKNTNEVFISRVSQLFFLKRPNLR